MNYREIENLKSLLLQMAKQGYRLRNDTFGIDGKIVGLGFKPYWTNPADSKIHKLEFNVSDNYGKVIPFYFYNVVGFNITAKDGARLDKSKDLSFEIQVFTPDKTREKEPYDKVSVQIYRE